MGNPVILAVGLKKSYRKSASTSWGENMGGIPADQRRDRKTMNRLKIIAEGIFHRYGVDFAAAKRAGGWSNATWLASGLALRLSVQQGHEDIRREAQLASLLPQEVCYPPVLETGVIDGYEWSLSKEVPGRNLGEIWPELDWDQRITALRQLWKKVEAVHSVDIAAASGLVRKRSLFYAANAEEARAGLIRLRNQKMLSSQQVEFLEEALGRFWKALATATCVLNHGDFTIENAIWFEGQVVSLLDFEYAMIAPDELDVNELVKFAFAPGDVLDSLPDPGKAGLGRMRQVVTDLAMPMLSHPGSKDLLLGYAILLEIWMLENRLAHPAEGSAVDQEPLYQILGSLADGYGGYLAHILAVVDAAL
jgi:aminoglycoside phosphotransferase